MVMTAMTLERTGLSMKNLENMARSHLAAWPDWAPGAGCPAGPPCPTWLGEPAWPGCPPGAGWGAGPLVAGAAWPPAGGWPSCRPGPPGPDRPGSAPPAGGRSARLHGRDRGSRPGHHQAADDDAIFRRQAAGDDPQAVHGHAGLTGLGSTTFLSLTTRT